QRGVVIDVDEARGHIFDMTDCPAPRLVQIISKILRPKSDRLLAPGGLDGKDICEIQCKSLPG
ncbi:MAG: hypothetical protein ACLQVY_03900, partial [Limisphaerales bacterium]